MTRHPLCLICSLWILGCACLPAHAQAPKPETQTLQVGEWYTVTCPRTFVVGTVADITVAYRGIAEKTKLCCDLHYRKTDGSYGGFYSNDWRPKPDIQGEGKWTFGVPIHDQQEIASANILLFTEPNGNWEGHTHEASSGPIPVFDPDPGYSVWTKQVHYNKSWIAFDWKALRGPLVEGNRLEVVLEYYLDPADHYKHTSLQLEALGPRVPKPNVPKPVSFDNTEHLWYGAQKVEVQPGRGRHTFVLTVPPAQSQNALLLIGLFLESRGQRWPWGVRADAWYTRRGGFFEIETDKPANLFTYDEPVQLHVRLRNVKTPGEQRALRYTVWDATRAQVAQGEVPFRVDREGQVIPVDLQLARRGTFLFRGEVEGWEARETTFCRIPDLAKLTGGKPTPFGMTVHLAPAQGRRMDTVFQIARRLGLTNCRSFTEWVALEPGPGVYAFDAWQSLFDCSHARGVDTILCIYDPPAWVMPEGGTVSYRMFDCDLKAFRDMVGAVSRQYKGKFAGWEWLNEISPGGTRDYVGDYVKLCQAGTETAAAVDPRFQFVLAGGLWPRNYRLDVLNAGAGKYITALPIHYGNGSGIQEARADLDAFGDSRAAVWDNETAGEMIAWNWPGLDVVSETTKSNWVLNQWADELNAGAQKIFYFGGEGTAIADWDYLLADQSPLPVAATLAVFTSKLWDAKPVGLFTSQGRAGVFQVFERQGKALLVASSQEPGGEEVSLAVGAPNLRLTDYQGNETEAPTRDGVATLRLAPLPCFVEGADLDVLRAYLAPAVQVPGAGARREVIGARPTVSLLRGQPASVPVRVWNPWPRAVAGALSLDLPPDWVSPAATRFSVPPGETRVLGVPVTVPAGVQPGAYPHRLQVRYDWAKLPVVDKPLVLSVLARESVGNLLTNGDFEMAEPGGVTPVGWEGTGATLFPSEGLGLGLGKRVLRFENRTDWSHEAQPLKLQGGATYLYTAWIWNHGLEGGSNLNQVMQDGSHHDLYDMQVMNMGDSTPYWQLFTCRYKAPADLALAAFVPVARGSGWAMYDNVRVTLFEGTDFAAEAYKVAKPPVIGGSLDGWDLRCPIPLIGRNQLQVLDPGFQWTPSKLNGVAYLNWDDKNLYVAVDVLDDAPHPAGEGETVTQGDSVTLAFDPTAGSPDGARRGFALYASSQKPAGGSGTVTLWRSRQHSGGLPAGHMARDSSVCEIAIRPEPGRCRYEMRLPFSVLGGVTPGFGGKLGFSMQLTGGGAAGPAARMTWGGGLSPSWSPGDFGRVTFVE